MQESPYLAAVRDRVIVFDGAMGTSVQGYDLDADAFGGCMGCNDYLPVTRPDVLYVVHRLPYPPDKGDRIRTFHILKWLSERATVHLASLADEPVDGATRATLERYCARLAVVPIGPGRWARALDSFAQGGYLGRGFDDLDWLPAARIEEASA